MAILLSGRTSRTGSKKLASVKTVQWITNLQNGSIYLAVQSVLGPLLFLVYINKVSNSVLYSNITMYADNIAPWKIIRNPTDYTLLQDDITIICNWVADNHLVLNLAKCCYIVFSRKHLPTNAYIRFMCW